MKEDYYVRLFCILILISYLTLSGLLCSVISPMLSFFSVAFFLVIQSIIGLCEQLYYCFQGHIFAINSVCIPLHVCVLYVQEACMIGCTICAEIEFPGLCCGCSSAHFLRLQVQTLLGSTCIARTSSPKGGGKRTDLYCDTEAI